MRKNEGLHINITERTKQQKCKNQNLVNFDSHFGIWLTEVFLEMPRLNSTQDALSEVCPGLYKLLNIATNELVWVGGSTFVGL